MHFKLFQVSTMLFFEQYNMGIPLFAPSLQFISQLHEQYFFVYFGTIDHKRGNGPSDLPAHPAYNGSARVTAYNNTNGTYSYSLLDPCNEHDPRAVRHWLSLADFYTMPHVVHFESVENLVDILDAMWNKPQSLQEISKAMRVENRARLKYILRYWRRRLLDIKEHSPFKPE